MEIKVITLIATMPRAQLLSHKALPSLYRQTQLPAECVIVSDRRPLTNKEKALIAQVLPSMQPYFLHNDRTPGVAGSWNTGLAFIAQHWPDYYVAVLDDDDEWSPDHIEACFEAARQTGWPDVVVSGLRLCKDGVEIPRTPPADLSVNDFLVGNLGWQGSNTFVSIAALLEVGGFTEGLASTNDRDLAVRLLSRPQTHVAYTGRHTATWHIESHRQCLSTPGNPAKIKGLAQFLTLHESRMNTEIQEQFFNRALSLFGITKADILREQERAFED